MQTHSFHIPVMGTGFTIDTPLKVARFGISSVISLGDDKLIEKIRRYYCREYQETYAPIPETDPDHRAGRITEYLNLVDRIVQRQIERMKQSSFDGENDLSRYFELMSDDRPLKKKYDEMLGEKNQQHKLPLETWLKDRISAGSIDVNIMAKADRENTLNGHKLPREYSNAMAALRGFAKSSLNSSVVFSAGLNLHLYSYVAEFDDFYADEAGQFKKKVTLKVSDFRSALVQAKILAKKGIWVSEYRVESGLNCGGHVFPSSGHLLGPILGEFKRRKQELVDTLWDIYHAALCEKKRPIPVERHRVHITAQGGVGTSAEHQFLLRYFEVDSVGWGSPFLLVPEATAVDVDTLNKLAKADEQAIYISNASPLGVPFYNLRNSLSEETRRKRIQSGKPGSACFSKYLAFNTEYGEPLCVASFQYQQRKIKELKEKNLSELDYDKELLKVLEKACICRDLGDGALLKYNIHDDKRELTPAVCPGPNLAYFSRICSLKEMIDHIYGRINVISPTVSRPHFLIGELKIYIGYLKDLISKSCPKITQKEAEYYNEFKQNLIGGIEYYKNLADSIREESHIAREKFISDLLALKVQLENLVLPVAVPSLQL